MPRKSQPAKQKDGNPRPDQLSQWQAEAMTVPECYDLALVGGRGGGKTRLLGSLFLRHCEQHGDAARCLVVRKSFPGLQDIEAEFKSFYFAVYGDACRYDSQKHRFTLPGGGTIQLDQLERESDFNKFQGKSFTHIAVDEVSQYSSPQLVDRLRASLRGPENIPVRFIVLANPGGVGHAWIARRYAIRKPWVPYVCPATEAEYVSIASTYRDNEFLDRPRYAKNLMAACATDPELGRAWLDGDWSVLRGAYFSSVIEEHRNLIEPWTRLPQAIDYKNNPNSVYHHDRTLCEQWRIYIASDYGAAAPSVTYLVAESPGAAGPDGFYYPKGSIVLVDESALVHPDDNNQGLGLTVPDQADRIKSLCQKWGAKPSGVADDAIFNKTGSQSGSIADEFRRAGVRFRKAQKGGRIAGWENMRRLLSDAGRPDAPGLYISRNCKYWWETVPALPRDPRKPEDVDSTAPDHAADACRYALTGRQPIFFTGIKCAM